MLLTLNSLLALYKIRSQWWGQCESGLSPFFLDCPIMATGGATPSDSSAQKELRANMYCNLLPADVVFRCQRCGGCGGQTSDVVCRRSDL